MNYFLPIVILLCFLGCSAQPAGPESMVARVVIDDIRVSEVINPEGAYPVIRSGQDLYGAKGELLNEVRGALPVAGKYPGDQHVYFLTGTEVKKIDPTGKVSFVKVYPEKQFPMEADFEFVKGIDYLAPKLLGGIGLVLRGDTIVQPPYHRIRLSGVVDGVPDKVWAYAANLRKPVLDSTHVYDSEGNLLQKFPGWIKEELSGNHFVLEQAVLFPGQKRHRLEYGVINDAGTAIIEPRYDVRKILPFGSDHFVAVRNNAADYIFDHDGNYVDSVQIITLQKEHYTEKTDDGLRAITFDKAETFDFEEDLSFDQGRYKASGKFSSSENFGVLRRNDTVFILDQALEVKRTLTTERPAVTLVDHNWLLIDGITLFSPPTGKEYILPRLSEKQEVAGVVYENGKAVRAIVSEKRGYLTVAQQLVDLATRERTKRYSAIKYLGGGLYSVKEGKVTSVVEFP